MRERLTGQYAGLVFWRGNARNSCPTRHAYTHNVGTRRWRGSRLGREGVSERSIALLNRTQGRPKGWRRAPKTLPPTGSISTHFFQHTTLHVLGEVLSRLSLSLSLVHVSQRPGTQGSAPATARSSSHPVCTDHFIAPLPAHLTRAHAHREAVVVDLNLRVELSHPRMPVVNLRVWLVPVVEPRRRRGDGVPPLPVRLHHRLCGLETAAVRMVYVEKKTVRKSSLFLAWWSNRLAQAYLFFTSQKNLTLSVRPSFSGDALRRGNAERDPPFSSVQCNRRTARKQKKRCLENPGKRKAGGGINRGTQMVPATIPAYIHMCSRPPPNQLVLRKICVFRNHLLPGLVEGRLGLPPLFPLYRPCSLSGLNISVSLRLARKSARLRQRRKSALLLLALFGKTDNHPKRARAGLAAPPGSKAGNNAESGERVSPRRRGAGAADGGRDRQA